MSVERVMVVLLTEVLTFYTATATVRPTGKITGRFF